MGEGKGILTVRVKRDYGIAGEVEFSATSGEAVALEGSKITYDLLTAKVLGAFDHFEDYILKDIKGAKKVADVTEVTVPATEITVEKTNGKTRYRVKCGQWMKHGVDFYPEHMKAQGINPAEIPEGGQVFSHGTMALVQLEDGIPRRVLKIGKPATS